MTKKRTIAGRISQHIVLFTGIFFIVTLLVIYRKVSDINIENALKSTEYAVLAGSESLNAQIMEIEVATKNLAWQVNEYKDDRMRLERFLKTFVKENNNIFGCALAPVPEFSRGNFEQNAISAYIDTLSGNIQMGLLYDQKYDYLMTNWYLIPKLLEQPVWTEPYFDEGNINEQITTYAFPVKDKKGNVICIVAAHITLDWINEVAEGKRVFPNSKTYILSKGGVFIYNADQGAWSDETLYSYALELGDTSISMNIYKMLQNKDDMIQFSSSQAKLIPKNIYYMYRKLDNGWNMIITTPLDDILGSNRTMIIYLAIIAIVGLTVLFIFLRKIIKTQTKSIKDFADAAREMAKSDFKENIKLPAVKLKDEVLVLRDSMEYMQNELHRYIEELQETTAKKQSYESELSIARKMQDSMVPSLFPNHYAFDIYGTVDPAKEIGGDLFGFELKRNKLFFYIGDVSGKGIPAALYMSFTISTLNFVINHNSNLGEGINQVNDYLCKNNTTGMFVTLFIGCLDLRNGIVEYCNCGHNQILRISPDRKAEFVEATPNIVIGAMEGFEFKTETMTIEHGTKLLLYTDGVTEAERADFTQFQNQRLLDWANGINHYIGSQQMVESLKTWVSSFTEGNVQNDDMTIFAIKYL